MYFFKEMSLGVNGEKKNVGLKLEGIILLIPVAKSSNSTVSVSLYVIKLFYISHEKQYHERCLSYFS